MGESIPAVSSFGQRVGTKGCGLLTRNQFLDQLWGVIGVEVIDPLRALVAEKSKFGVDLWTNHRPSLEPNDRGNMKEGRAEALPSPAAFAARIRWRTELTFSRAL